MMKTLMMGAFALVACLAFSQSASSSPNFVKTNNIENSAGFSGKSAANTVALLIPKKSRGLYGFVDQNSKVVIPPKFTNVGFFTEDCNLLNSPKAEIRKFGSKDYASVMKGGKDYRIDRTGNVVYEFKTEDLGKCVDNYRKQIYYGYSNNGLYGITKLTKTSNNVHNFQIEPQYQLVHVMEGNDLENPMIIAVRGDKFGVIDKDNKVIIPFMYADIKRNFSWKLASLFEVTKNGNDYYFVDTDNKKY